MHNLIIHALAVWSGDERKCKIRATIRSGKPVRGDEVWFHTRDLAKKKLTIADVHESPRLSTIALEGEPDAVAALEGGMYLRQD